MPSLQNHSTSGKTWTAMEPEYQRFLIREKAKTEFIIKHSKHVRPSRMRMKVYAWKSRQSNPKQFSRFGQMIFGSSGDSVMP